MLRQALLAASDSERLGELVRTVPIARGLVRRYVAGETTADALRVAARLREEGLLVSLDHLGEHTTEPEHAEAAVDAYVELLKGLADQGLSDAAEVSMKPSAVGLHLDDGEATATANVRRVCEAAADAGTTVTLDMEDHNTVDATLRIVREIRRDHPELGSVLQSYLRRTEADVAEMSYQGSRVRLCKGAYAPIESDSYTEKRDIDASYVRCMKRLMSGKAYPMLATHDPRLIEIAGSLAVLNERPEDEFEYQMLYGIRPDEQRRLARMGGQVRVYVPYGTDWYGYLMRRLAEKPSNLALFLRSLPGRG
ncbi:MAG: proline dehydrogenase [Streptosporangiales bacterium]|nr:proline dehydrogenase [Streptosporangiales bacterium]